MKVKAYKPSGKENPRRLKERNRYIYAQRLKGRTYANIADEHGITIERVRQICMKEERLIKGEQ